MRLRPRLALSHGIIIGLAICVFPVALYAIHRLAAATDQLVSEQTHAVEAADAIRSQLTAEYTLLLQWMLTPDEESSTQVAQGDQALRTAIDDARPYFVAPAERQVLNEFEQRYIHLQNAIAIWRSGQMNRPGLHELPADFEAVSAAAIGLHESKTAAMSALARATDEFAHTMFGLLGALALLVLCIGMLALLRQVRGITRPVDQLGELIQRMSEGDFEIVYERGPIDEFNALGRHFEITGQAMRAFRAANIERLVVEQRRTDAVLDNIGDGLVIFAEDGAIERISPVAARQLGVDAAAAIGRRFEDVCAAPEIGERVREVLQAGELAAPTSPELVVEREGDRRVLSYWLNRFVETESGRAGAVLVLRDVTAQREFDKMRSEFVLRASHELRTPITSIRMGLALIEEKFQFPAGSRERELYDTVQQELRRMVGLLTDLLDLSRLRVGELTLERIPTDIGEVLYDARQRFVPAATGAGVALELEVEQPLPRISLCRSQFDRVLDNLISNALRHTEQGGSIMLSARRTPERVAIGVSDTGDGIPYAQQALIFQPFVQIGRKRGGAGLGLAICKEIVQQHGGEINVASVPRRGTTFTLLLPV